MALTRRVAVTVLAVAPAVVYSWRAKQALRRLALAVSRAVPAALVALVVLTLTAAAAEVVAGMCVLVRAIPALAA